MICIDGESQVRIKCVVLLGNRFVLIYLYNYRINAFKHRVFHLNRAANCLIISSFLPRIK